MKHRAPYNRTITLTEKERKRFLSQIDRLTTPSAVGNVLNKVFCQDMMEAVVLLPENFVDLLILDPPYNLSKRYNSHQFRRMDEYEYEQWMEQWFVPLLRLLKPTSSVYICSEWQTSGIIQRVCERYLKVRNRITWEREKGRGARKNWKNASEDIWFCTVSDEYTFNVDAVKLKRRVLAPYRTDGKPKDWQEHGKQKYRFTYPSNLWTDITVPFWSMPENTDHPTQKSEKLVAKLILASTRVGDVVLDPFLGSGTTAVVARKLGRHFVGIEKDEEYCCYALKRLEYAQHDKRIQGYEDGVFWERNTIIR
ncbi:MAG: site-specific DNA-methyltransferase [Bacteroidetes bacterium]|nr:site-specific DNA-methyltransferase [Bacteroidota bacterium]